jgi:hypothetical protein
MKQQGSTKQLNRHVPAFVAAGLFYLTGVIYIVTAMHSRQILSWSLAAMFIGIGSLWVAIGAKYKKEDQQN